LYINVLKKDEKIFKNCLLYETINYHKFKIAYQKYNAMCDSFKNVFWTSNIIINIIKCHKFFREIREKPKSESIQEELL